MHLLPSAAEHIARVLNTMAIFLSQCWRPEVYNEVASRTAHTWKAEEGSFLASSPFLVFPAVFGVSQSADSSFRILPRSSTQHSTMSLWVWWAAFIFLIKTPIILNLDPNLSQHNLTFTEHLQGCYFQSNYIVSTAIPHRACPILSHLRSQ